MLGFFIYTAKLSDAGFLLRICIYMCLTLFPCFPGGEVLRVSYYNTGDTMYNFNLWWKIPEGNGSPLHSCPEVP